MKAYCIFDDFPTDCIKQLELSGIATTVLEKGCARPDDVEMKLIFEEYDIVIIGTSQKIGESMWENISAPRTVATASVGVDHIKVPSEKTHLLTVLNAPTANAQSVAEYTICAMLMARKRFLEGNALYAMGKNNKSLIRKPEDISGTTVGLIGAGHISTKIMELLMPFGVKFLCYTKNPAQHMDLTERFGTKFVCLKQLVTQSDVISVNVPSDSSTENLIDAAMVKEMKDDCIFISISRANVVDNQALVAKAEKNSNFYIVLDLDVLPEYVGKNNGRNIVITPHIAGGTIESRKRMFAEVTSGLINTVKKS